MGGEFLGGDDAFNIRNFMPDPGSRETRTSAAPTRSIACKGRDHADSGFHHDVTLAGIVAGARHRPQAHRRSAPSLVTMLGLAGLVICQIRCHRTMAKSSVMMSRIWRDASTDGKQTLGHDVTAAQQLDGVDAFGDQPAPHRQGNRRRNDDRQHGVVVEGHLDRSSRPRSATRRYCRKRPPPCRRWQTRRWGCPGRAATIWQT